MIQQSACKINLGLHIKSRRADGYHQIETLMYPVRELTDIIEIQNSDTFAFTTSGIAVDCPTQNNLCVRAFNLMQQSYQLTQASIHLHKRIPSGAGLGGGSANATQVIKMCNRLYSLGLGNDTMRELASILGSDTPFFVEPVPQIATGRGEMLKPFELSLGGLWLLLVKADVGVSTAQAYAGVTPNADSAPLCEILKMPLHRWSELLVNDFERSVFAQLPLLATIKAQLYDKGAIYAAMSGSGSTVFGLFESKPTQIAGYFNHLEQL